MLESIFYASAYVCTHPSGVNLYPACRIGERIVLKRATLYGVRSDLQGEHCHRCSISHESVSGLAAPTRPPTSERRRPTSVDVLASLVHFFFPSSLDTLEGGGHGQVPTASSTLLK